MKKILVILLFSYISYLVFTTSCANPGMPTGGDKDSIPPVVVRTVPEQNTRNFKGNSVSITFNEFVISDELSTMLVVSPPMEKKPVIRTKSKTLTIELGDSLRPNVTYSLDFRDAIADNNEKNPLDDFRFAFSTGPEFDSLMLGGYVLNALNMEPVEDATVLLYEASDSLFSFRDKLPKYIGRTDEEGFYTFTNVAKGKYRLFALEDADNSMNYNQPGERIAFFDSLASPSDPGISGTVNLDSVHFREIADSLQAVIDTLADEGTISRKINIDSLATSERIVPGVFDADSLKPGRQASKAEMIPHYLLMFKENTFENFLDDYTRDQRNLIRFYFSNSVSDSFRVNLLSPQPAPPRWFYPEYNAGRDSILLWITDTVVSSSDTLMLQLKYETLDTLNQLTSKLDTLELIYKDPIQRGRRKKDKEETPVIQNFSLQTNVTDGFDPYLPVAIEAPEPLAAFDYSKIHLYQKVDTLEEMRTFDVEQDTILARKYRVRHPWVFEGRYRIVIDSAAAMTFSGQPSSAIDQEFTTQKQNFYGKIFMNITHVPGNCIVQLLKNTEKEEVLNQILIEKDQEIVFPFVKPEKYKIKLIVDRNRNGHWDTGDLKQREQPERVVYYSKVIKIRSNFEVHEDWVLPDDLQRKKELIDEEQDAKDKKNKSSKPAKKSLR